MSHKPSYTEYDAKFDAWFAEVARILGEGDKPLHEVYQKYEKFYPHDSFDCDETPQQFVDRDVKS